MPEIHSQRLGHPSASPARRRIRDAEATARSANLLLPEKAEHLEAQLGPITSADRSPLIELDEEALMPHRRHFPHVPHRMRPLAVSTPAKTLTAAALAVLVSCFVTGCGSANSDRSARIAGDIHADWCAGSAYGIQNRFDGSKSRIYNCMMKSGRYRCVTYANGIENDVTSAAQLLFASALGGGKPTCLS